MPYFGIPKNVTDKILKKLDINKVILKTDLYDITDNNLSTKIFSLGRIVLNFYNNNDPTYQCTMKIDVSNDGNILYNNYEITFCKIIFDNEYGTKFYHSKHGPAKIIYENNQPTDIFYYIDGYKTRFDGPAEITLTKTNYFILGNSISENLYNKILNDCKINKLEQFDDFNDHGIMMAELMAEYYKANNFYDNIQDIKLANELDGTSHNIKFNGWRNQSAVLRYPI